MKKKFDIVLLSPPSRSFNHYRPPMALIYLAGYLKHNNLSCKIIDVTEKTVIRNKKFFDQINKHRQSIEDEIIKQIKNNPTNIYGITCYTPEYFEVLDLAKKIKEINPKATIIVGGIHPTLYPNELFEEKNTPVDFEVIGEGEETLFELLTAIKNKINDFSKIKGIAYLNKDKIVNNPLRPLQENLDCISFADYDQIDMEYYSNASPYSIRGCFLRSAYLLATRGCPSACTFCVAKKLRNYNGGGKYTRVRSAKNLIKEIKHLYKKYQIDSFYFIDDLFTINQNNVEEFCHLLKKEKLHLLWGCSSKVSTLNENLLKKMSQSGCIQIDFGIERGSNKALNDIKKGISIEMISKVFNLCHKFHIRTFANFLVNLPNETKKDLNDITNFAKKIKPDIVSINVFTPYPGTEIYDQSSYKFTKDEYQTLTYASILIKKSPEKFRFSKHKIDILSWANSKNNEFNRLLPNIIFHLSPRYLSIIIKSKRKLNYFSQFKFLIQELINQKYSN
ncbi:MAG: radical SAM protein [Candidatus Shapirobacteria bacterium]|jgi:radical SAM superfamily enzyme YgiQ (UPF0313 family)